MVTNGQCRAARILLGWSAAALVQGSGISIATIKRFESGQVVQAATAKAIEAALVAGGIRFLAEGEPSSAGGAGVRLI